MEPQTAVRIYGGRQGQYVRQQKEKEAGQKTDLLVSQTFGCQMNARDSEKLSGILEDDRVCGDR